jgi:hypothetical protein
MSEISFRLLPKCRETLLAAVPQYSEIWNALRYACRPTSGSVDQAHYQILCDPAGAELLLQFARSHCPDAVEVIELAVRRSRALRT